MKLKELSGHVVDQLHHLLEVFLGLAGKALMKSELIAMSGRMARSLRMVLLYSMAV